MIFQVIVDSELPGGLVLRIAGLSLAVLLSVAVIAGVVARWIGCDRTMTAAVVLVVMLPNAGNFGLPISLFAFGEDGLARASIFFITASLVTVTLGVLVASIGRTPLPAAVAGLLRVPAVWSIAIALVVLRFGWTLPSPVARTVGLFSQATIPVFLLILGMQLHGSRLRASLGPLAWATVARLILSPVLALVFVSVLGLDGVSRQTAVLQAAMPSAVITIVLALEYDIHPGFVTTAVFVSTVISPLTLTPLLVFLGA
jgi:predicted permease